MSVQVFGAFDPPPKVQLLCREKSLTRQSEADACDVNLIVKRYEKTGVLPTDGREGFFADVSQMGDYRTAVHQVRGAEAAFMQLPWQLRRRFEDDPAVFLDFVADPANREEMVKLGLIEDVSGKVPAEPQKPDSNPPPVVPKPPEG